MPKPCLAPVGLGNRSDLCLLRTVIADRHIHDTAVSKVQHGLSKVAPHAFHL